MALIGTAFWIGASAAFVLGYFGPAGLAALKLHWQAAIVAAMLVPVGLIWIGAILARRAEALRLTTEDLALIAWRLTQPEDAAAREVARLGRAIRGELDAMNEGVQTALTGVRGLEAELDARTEALQSLASGLAERVDTIRSALVRETDRLAELSRGLDETLAGMGARVTDQVEAARAAADAASAKLSAAADEIDTRISGLREAAAAAAEESEAAAARIEAESARFAASADTAVARAEDLTTREAAQREALEAAAGRLRTDSEGLAAAIERQRTAIEAATAALAQELGRIDVLATEGARRLEDVAAGLGTRLEELGTGIAREGERARQTGDEASTALEATQRALLDIGERTRAALEAETAQALRRLDDVTARATEATVKLTSALGRLSVPAPAEAQTGAAPAPIPTPAAAPAAIPVAPGPAAAGPAAAEMDPSVRSADPAWLRRARADDAPAPPTAETRPRAETPRIIRGPLHLTEETPDDTASEQAAPPRRTTEPAPAAPAAAGADRPGPHDDDEDVEPRPAGGTAGWMEFARRLAGRDRREELGPAPWRLSSVLKAADRAHAEAPAAERARLQSMSLRVIETLEALAIDLNRALEDDPPLELWRRFLGGERSVFARRLIALLGRDHQDRISDKYERDEEFRDYVDRYLRTFETLLAEAQNSADPKMAETYLTSQTGKVYLILANAVGRGSRPPLQARGD